MKSLKDAETEQRKEKQKEYHKKYNERKKSKTDIDDVVGDLS
jgi:hypothetical protein